MVLTSDGIMAAKYISFKEHLVTYCFFRWFIRKLALLVPAALVVTLAMAGSMSGKTSEDSSTTMIRRKGTYC
jgi:hypothetical protein